MQQQSMDDVALKEALLRLEYYRRRRATAQQGNGTAEPEMMASSAECPPPIRYDASAVILASQGIQVHESIDFCGFVVGCFECLSR